jgi:subtilase family serine protease
VLDSGDVSLGSTTIVSLGAGASATVRTTGSIPAATPEGTHYILVKADVTNSVVESNESNNVKVVAITIGRSSPDLVVSSVSAPATARRGTTIAIAHTIRNQGTDQAGVSRVGFYLSRGAARGDDVELGSREVTSLYMGLATTATKTVAIPSTVTAGTYSLLVVADADGAVAESEETNNTGIRTITIR